MNWQSITIDCKFYRINNRGTNYVKVRKVNIKMNKRLPLDKEEHYGNLIDVSKISIEELNDLLDKGFKDFEEGNYQTVEEAFKSIYD